MRGFGPDLSRDGGSGSQPARGSLLCSCQTVVPPEQSAQGTARHRFAVATQVFFVHGFFVRLPRFRFYGDLRSQ